MAENSNSFAEQSIEQDTARLLELFQKLDEERKKEYFEHLQQAINPNKMNMDVRALVLCKSSLNSTSFLDCFRKDATRKEAGTRRTDYRSYAALSSMADSIQTFKLDIPDEKSLLQTVFKVNNSLSSQLDGTVFANPQYVIHHYADNKKLEFWEDKEGDNFFFMSTYNLLLPTVSFEERERIRRELSTNIDRYRKKQQADFRYIVYESLDLLNDFVVLWKARNVRPVLEILNQCYRFANRSLGHTRTIFAVDWVKLSDDHIEHLLEAIGEPEGKSANIDNMTIRAVSNDYIALMQVKNELVELEEKNMTLSDDKGSHCFVLGNTDHISFFRGVDDRMLCLYLKALIDRIKDKTLTKAITRIETSIGISEDELDEKYGCNNQLEKPVPEDKLLLNKAAEYLIKQMNDILWDDTVFDLVCAPWKHTVLELCNQLRHMSNSCIYDSVCFLLLDSVYLFQQWLEQVPCYWKPETDNAKIILLKRRAKHINTYVHNWMHLTDIIARALGIVAHMPGYSPALYHMSTAILEFCHSFFSVTSAFLRKLGDTSITQCRDDIACILIPTQCRRIKTFEDFEEGIDDSKLVNVEIPLELLSNPLKIVTMLTHEAGHRYGLSSLCEREFRWKCYAGALALQVAEDIGIEFNLEEIQDLACPLPDDTKNYRLVMTIERCVKHIEEKMKKRSDGNKLVGYNLKAEAEDLAYLFKESYADLVMIQLLKCDFRTYFENIFLHQPEWERLRLSLTNEEDAWGLDAVDRPEIMEEKDSIDPAFVYARLAMRLFVVCKAAQETDLNYDLTVDDKWSGYTAENFDSEDDQKHLEEHIDKVRTYYEKAAQAHESLIRSDDNFFNPVVLTSCIRYLIKCGQTITNAFQNAAKEEIDELKEIQNYFINVKEKTCFFQKPYYDLVHKNRQRVLNQINPVDGSPKGKFKFGSFGD